MENVAAAVENANEAPEYNPPCENGEDDRRSDLCAQWRAADAARSAANATWLFGIIGGLIGGATLIAAVAAAQYAKRAAAAAREGVDDARQYAAENATSTAATLAEAARSADAMVDLAKATHGMVQTDRAWLCPGQISLIHNTNGRIGTKRVKNGIGFLLYWENKGRSPAIRSVIAINWKIIPYGSDVLPIFPDLDPPDTDFRMIGPGADATARPLLFSDADSADFRNRKTQIIIWSRAWYFDTFSDISNKANRRYTEVCLRATHMGGTIDHGSAEPREYVDYVTIGPQNNAT